MQLRNSVETPDLIQPPFYREREKVQLWEEFDKGCHFSLKRKKAHLETEMKTDSPHGDRHQAVSGAGRELGTEIRREDTGREEPNLQRGQKRQRQRETATGWGRDGVLREQERAGQRPGRGSETQRGRQTAEARGPERRER